MSDTQNQSEKDGNLDHFERYAMALGGCFLLFLVPVPVVIYSVLLLLVITLLLLYNKRKLYEAETHERRALQALITIFWRFSYLSLVAFLVAASFLLAFGDSSALEDVQRKIQAGVMVSESTIVAAMHRYQSENHMVVIIGNLLGFLPLVAYCVSRLKKTVDAFRAQKEIDPKAWR
jgi:hypothetical protein